MKGGRRLVIDSTITHTAGGEASTHPTGKNCREFLKKVLTICHQVVVTPDVSQEWKRGHLSKFAVRWLAAMESKSKVYRIHPEPSELREEIAELPVTENQKAIMLKDAFLLEAALATKDRTVISLDEEARRLFGQNTESLVTLKKIQWINPDKEEDSAFDWLARGAKPEKVRKLGSKPKKER